ncbi:MAG TPA: tRNA uridine-5-carboxymethylaminomethyl(34) synthesis GTPase MnmE [Verrucomicrobiales bacterium]|nr:tRNA uridine-5-carboxymethylaminomethyl(34) synthesis GTPase MnmE [Verrucomicrobiales bacterium]
MRSDTIVAIGTAAGESAIALIRVSGPDASSCLANVWRGIDPASARPRTLYLGIIAGADGTALDQVLCVRFPKPFSYTGEDMVEIHCHGGTLVTRAVFDRLLEAGCRPAGPGEFTQRAFLNGKMDLTQAEAVMDLIQARTRLALRAANDQLAGGLRDTVEEIRTGLVSLLAHIEAWIDFPEEDIAPDTLAELAERTRRLIASIDTLLESAEKGRVLREGARVVICGEANAGKSSLLNLLLGFDRAIVSESPGTTRDTIEEVINAGGIPLRLVDTAGLRDASDPVEQEGMRRAAAEILRADVIIEVLDGSIAPEASTSPLPRGFRGHHLRLLNKSDLGLHPAHAKDREAFPFSCLRKEGIGALQAALHQHLLSGDVPGAGLLLAINARHQHCLQRASRALDSALEGMRQGLAWELIALECREALEALGEVTGKTDIEEILGEIFAKFCIGK